MPLNPQSAGTQMMVPARNLIGNADSLKSDTVDLAVGGVKIVAKAIRIGTTGGDLIVDSVGGSTNQTIPNVQVGETVVGQFTRIRASTACAGMTVYYD